MWSRITGKDWLHARARSNGERSGRRTIYPFGTIAIVALVTVTSLSLWWWSGQGRPASQSAGDYYIKSHSSGPFEAAISAGGAGWILDAARHAIESGSVATIHKAAAVPPEVARPRDTVLLLTVYGAGQNPQSPALIDRPPSKSSGQGRATFQGAGSSLREALEKAVSNVLGAQQFRPAQGHDVLTSRIKLDVLIGRPEPIDKPAPEGEGDTAEDLIDVGADGIEIDAGKTKRYLPPSELIYDAIVAADPGFQEGSDLLDGAMEAAGLSKDAWHSEAVKLYRFRTASFVEDSTHTRSLPVVRGFVTNQEITRARLLSAARAGGDYLVRAQQPSGQFDYEYDALSNTVPGNRYNIIRHAGAAVSLFDLYEETKDHRYLESALRAVDYLKTRFQLAPAELEAHEMDPASRTTKAYRLNFQGSGTQAIYVLDYDGKSRLGANGLALLALTKEIRLAPKPSDKTMADGLAVAITQVQRTDGSLGMYYSASKEEEEEGYSLYYPGEAMLGMMELYRLTRNPRLLATVKRGADYLIDSERAQESLPADAWFIQALELLHEFDPSTKYTAHAIDLAQAMTAAQYTPSAPEGFAGAVSPGLPRATPAGSRSEGTLAGYRLARALGDARAPGMLAAIESSAIFQMSQQFNPDNSFFLPDPARALGGFHESIISMRIRIDYVQHNVCALLALAKSIH